VSTTSRLLEERDAALAHARSLAAGIEAKLGIEPEMFALLLMGAELLRLMILVQRFTILAAVSKIDESVKPE